jgi:hypothetical protein
MEVSVKSWGYPQIIQVVDRFRIETTMVTLPTSFGANGTAGAQLSDNEVCQNVCDQTAIVAGPTSW